MRDIKFRVWDGKKYWYSNKTKPWLFDNNAMFRSNERTVSIDLINCAWNDIEQYTGLKDKNGKEIYEGDIVTGYYENLSVDYSECGAVEMGYTHDSDGYANGSTYGWVLSNSSSLADVISYGQCEIIGNIHENTELLES